MSSTNKTFIGPFCDSLSISTENHENYSIKNVHNCVPKNGLVIELCRYASKCKLPSRKVASWLMKLFPKQFDCSVKTIESRIARTLETEKKIGKKKKKTPFKTYEEFQSTEFMINSAKKLYLSSHISFCKEIVNDFVCQRESEICNNEIIKPITNLSPKKSNSKLENAEFESMSKSEKKTINLYDYEIKLKQKTLKNLQTSCELAEENLKHVNSRIGQYSVRNVNKRDDTSNRNLHLLRDAQRQILRLKKNTENDAKTIESLTEEIQILHKNTTEEIKNHLSNKHRVQKAVSYYKNKISKLRDLLFKNSDEQLRTLQIRMTDYEARIAELESSNVHLQDQLNERQISTRNKDGSFNDNIRLNVIELSGLEVAVEKVPKVIQTVAKHLFSCDLKDNDLPNKTTVQSIVDEGHYLAKTYIASQVQNAESFGLNRDGTTRKTKKILDTTVPLNSGKVMSLSFTHVASETAETIHSVAKEQINELVDLSMLKMIMKIESP